MVEGVGQGLLLRLSLSGLYLVIVTPKLAMGFSGFGQFEPVVLAYFWGMPFGKQAYWSIPRLQI